MERCDFSSISTCLKNQISESNQMNQPDFLYELFEDFMNDPINEDFSMDNGLIEYYGAAEPPVRCGESHLSGLTEPPHFVY